MAKLNRFLLWILWLWYQIVIIVAPLQIQMVVTINSQLHNIHNMPVYRQGWLHICDTSVISIESTAPSALCAHYNVNAFITLLSHSGSHLTFATNPLANALKARKITSITMVSGIEQIAAPASKYKIDLTLHSTHECVPRTIDSLKAVKLCFE